MRSKRLNLFSSYNSSADKKLKMQNVFRIDRLRPREEFYYVKKIIPLKDPHSLLFYETYSKHHELCLKILIQLHKNKLLTFDIFSLIKNLDQQQLAKLNILLNEVFEMQISTRKLENVLQAFQNTDCSEQLVNIFAILKDQNLLRSKYIDLLVKNIAEIEEIHKILDLFQYQGLLNQSNIKCSLKIPNFKKLSLFLSPLKLNSIPLQKDTMHFIAQLSENLFRSAYTFFYHIDTELFTYLIETHNLSNRLLKYDMNVLNNPINISIIHLLSDNKLLCPKVLTLLLNRIQSFMKMESQQPFSISDYFYKIILFLVDRKKFKLEHFKNLVALCPSYYLQLYNQLNNLECHKLLNDKNLSKLFHYFSNKLSIPTIEEFEVVREKLKGVEENIIFHKKNSQFEVMAHVDMTHVGIHGGRADILEAVSNEAIPTKYSIKKLHLNQTDNKNLYLKEAHREAKYNLYFHRNPHLSINNDDYLIIIKWQEGKALSQIPKKTLDELNIKEKLQALTRLLQELVELHALNRVHGDINIKNCVFNPKTLSLHLIDFGSAHKIKPRNYLIPTTPFAIDYQTTVENSNNRYTFCDDMYALSFVVAFLFPMQYHIQYFFKNSKITLLKNTLTHQELAIDNLMNSLLNKNREARCTSKDALEYCNLVLKHYENLSEEKLQSILNETCHRKNLSFEEVIHGHTFNENDQTMISRVC